MFWTKQSDRCSKAGMAWLYTFSELRHKTKFYNLTLADFRHCKVYIKPLAHLRHSYSITRQAETHASPFPRNREQYLNKN